MTAPANARARSSHSSIGRASLLASALALVACGGAPEAAPRAPEGSGSTDSTAPAAKSPPAKPDAETSTSEPRSVEEAQAQIARARADLEGPSKAGSTKSVAEEPARGPTPRTEAQPVRRPEGTDDLCGASCRALGSMRRAVEALCRMTGDTDERCLDAKRTLTESTTRISTCKCDAR